MSEFEKAESFQVERVEHTYQLRRRSLGGAIFLAAIEDYRGLDEKAHEHAGRFLYPQNAQWQDHYDWAVSLTEATSAAWLRDVLDRFRGEWDRQRARRMSRRRRVGRGWRR